MLRWSLPALLALLALHADCLAAPPAPPGPPAGYTLEQLHVIFRHGNRTPEAPYPKDPNKDDIWSPTGWDQLSKAGIESTYREGVMFRQRYDSFLGETYYQSEVNATSTDIPRTKQCLQAFMAGLYPPRAEQLWAAVNASRLGSEWQPFVYHYMPRHLDDFLYMNGVTCPRYNQEFDEVEHGDWFRAILDKDPEMLAVLKEKGGVDVTKLSDISRFYCTVSIETFEGRIVPDWVKPFYPDRLEKMALWHFHARALTRSMQRFKGGPLVKHMVSKMLGAASAVQQPRLWIYSGHDDTVSETALAIRSWGPVYPDFNAMLVLELLKEKDTGAYAVQVLLRENQATELHVVNVEGCSSPCPLDTFQRLVKDVIPNDWRKECQAGSGAASYGTVSLAILLLVSTTLWTRAL